MPTDAEIYEGRLQALQSRDDEIARLRALGAEMLAALRRLASDANFRANGHTPQCGCCVCEARAAIAKAEGSALKTAETMDDDRKNLVRGLGAEVLAHLKIMVASMRAHIEARGGFKAERQAIKDAENVIAKAEGHAQKTALRTTEERNG